MPRLFPVSFLLAASLSGLAACLSGCVVEHTVTPGPGPVQTVCEPPAFTNSHDAYPLYRVAPGVATSFDATDGRPTYALTAGGGGSFRLVWSDPQNAPTCFAGLITTDARFSQAAVGYSGHESIVFNQSNQIAFASIPGSNLDGVDFVVDTEPVFIDAFVDSGTSTTIYYTDSGTGVETDTNNANVAAFTSP